jgi:YcxB-like protein
MTLRYQLTGDDYLQCVRVHKPGAHGRIAPVASLLIVAIGAVWLALPGGERWGWSTVVLGVALFVLSLLLPWRLREQVRRQWSQMDPIELVVTEAGLIAKTRDAQSEMGWARFVRLHEAAQHFMLYKSHDLYMIVPKRGFEAESDVAEFRDMCGRRVGQA